MASCRLAQLCSANATRGSHRLLQQRPHKKRLSESKKPAKYVVAFRRLHTFGIERMTFKVRGQVLRFKRDSINLSEAHPSLIMLNVDSTLILIATGPFDGSIKNGQLATLYSAGRLSVAIVR